MNRHLLLIGGGVLQVPVIEHARALGVKVLCLDGNPSAPARRLADWFETVDIKDKDACLAAARSHQSAYRLDGVVTVGTDFSTTVAWIADSLGLPGTPYEAALRAKDKGLMRSCFEKNGVASPRHQVVTSSSEPCDLPLPLVVKPADSMGARGVRLASDAAELRLAVTDALQFSSTGRAVVEEYIDGPEFSLDAIVRGGQLVRCGLADRRIVFPPAFVELGHTFPSAASSEVIEAVWSEFEKGVKALGLSWGAAKGDVKYSPGRGAIIGEIASRLSGGYMSGWTYPLTSGRSAVRWAVETALGLELSSQPEETSVPVAERAWIGLPGRIRAVRGVDLARSLPGVKEVFISVAAGSVTRFPRNNVEKLGNVIAVGATPAEAEAHARAARFAVAFEYERSSQTDAFLAGGAEHWWFPQARGAADAGPGWLERGGGWLDAYGDSLGDLAARLEAEGLSPLSRGAVFWRALAVGGLNGARYAAEQP